MFPRNRDAPECPDGYRRYVYRINVKLPSRIRFPYGVGTESLPDPPFEDLPPNVNVDPPDDDKKKDQDEEKKTT